MSHEAKSMRSVLCFEKSYTTTENTTFQTVNNYTVKSQNTFVYSLLLYITQVNSLRRQLASCRQIVLASFGSTVNPLWLNIL